MARKKLIVTDQFPYHITNRSNNKDFFYLELDKLWEITAESLRTLQNEYGCIIHAFVLMSNHYHLIISTPKLNLSQAMHYFHCEVARISNRKSNRINHFFGTRYKWCLISHENYYWNAVKYIFRNPIKAQFCEKVQDYKFSSLNDCANVDIWRMTDFFLDPNQVIELDLNWLNEKFHGEQNEAIQCALRRKEFKISKNRRGRIISLDAAQPKKGCNTF
ncbi:MAG: transposase [Bdellovibrionales bacterium]